jgi:hypothetical protein
METKVCSKCGVTQNVLEFRKDITKKDGLRPDCKLCVKSYEMSRRNDDPTMMKEKLKNFYKHNPEKRKEYRKTPLRARQCVLLALLKPHRARPRKTGCARSVRKNRIA